jgi:hypothetical protein
MTNFDNSANLATVSTDNPFTGLFLHITALEGHCEITISLNVCAVNMKFFSKDSFIDQTVISSRAVVFNLG